MTTLTLEGHLGRSVVIDLCETCQAFWFDGYESLQLAPASILQLFRIIGDAATRAVRPLPDTATCPRCGRALRQVKDRQRQTTFEYRGCPHRHGRLISFFNFLREKDFIRPLSPAQVHELRQNVQTVNCSNCGAPVDLALGAACAHCGSPLSMLDVSQADALVAKLRAQAEAPAARVDPALPLSLLEARRDVVTAFAEFERQPGWYEQASSAGLVGAAMNSFVRWLGV